MTAWEFEGRRSGEKWSVTLRAYWEVVLDPLSDDFRPDTMSASGLMKLWLGRIEGRRFPNGLIPIYWYVNSPDSDVFESMPFQYQHYPGQTREDFLSFFTWPTKMYTEERLNWLEARDTPALRIPGLIDEDVRLAKAITNGALDG